MYQRPDGLFHNVVDRPDTFVETNLAQMLAFTIYQGITDQWLPATYRPQPTACAQQPAPRWINTASSRAPAAPPTSTAPASPLKRRPSASSWSQPGSRSSRSGELGQYESPGTPERLSSRPKRRDLQLSLKTLHHHPKSVCRICPENSNSKRRLVVANREGAAVLQAAELMRIGSLAFRPGDSTLF